MCDVYVDVGLGVCINIGGILMHVHVSVALYMRFPVRMFV